VIARVLVLLALVSPVATAVGLISPVAVAVETPKPGHVKTHAVPVVQPPAHATPRVPARPAPRHAVPVPAPVPVPAAPIPAPVAPAEPPKGSNTGLPLPRFASLRGEEVNLRSGPGTRYPIEWVYKRRDLPVEIEREFEAWRLVQDQEGVKGWVHQAVLTGRRTFVVTVAERVVRSEPKDDGAPVARLKVAVIGRIRSCDAGVDWCQVQVQDYRGWLKRTDFWGSAPGEVIQ